MDAVEQKHIPFGRPRMLQVNQSYCVLHQEAFVSGYSQQARMTLWTSFTMDSLVGSLPKGGNHNTLVLVVNKLVPGSWDTIKTA